MQCSDDSYVMVSCGCMDTNDYNHDCVGTRMSLIGDIND